LSVFKPNLQPHRKSVDLNTNGASIMAKRKRDDETSKLTGLAGAKGARIQYKVETSTAKVRHAFKVARGFERPKMDKRRRAAAAAAHTNTVDDIERIESERSALQVSFCSP
jgi:hypothetical protein